jgi:hypothetical protein
MHIACIKVLVVIRKYVIVYACVCCVSYMYVCAYIYIYIYIYIHTHIYIHKHTYTHTGKVVLEGKSADEVYEMYTHTHTYIHTYTGQSSLGGQVRRRGVRNVTSGGGKLSGPLPSKPVQALRFQGICLSLCLFIREFGCRCVRYNMCVYTYVCTHTYIHNTIQCIYMREE